MRHRQLTEQSKGVPFNQVMLKAIGYTTIFCVIIAAIVLVWANDDEIDNNAKMGFEIIGFLLLTSFSVYWLVKKVTGRI